MVIEQSSEVNQSRIPPRHSGVASLCVREAFHGELTQLRQQLVAMCALAAHIADTARFSHPDHAVPADLEAHSPNWARSPPAWPTG